MKKLILMATMVGVSMNIYAQGTVDFRNWVGSSPGFVYAPVYDPDGALLGNSNFVAQLFYSSNTSAAESSLTAVADLPATFRSGAGAGFWSLGLNFNPSRTLPGIIAGSNALVQVRVWDQSVFGPTGYTIASTTFGAQVGKSTMFSMETGGAGAPPTPPFFMTGLTSFNTIIVVPEPSTIALGMLGAVFFLMRKRM